MFQEEMSLWKKILFGVLAVVVASMLVVFPFIKPIINGEFSFTPTPTKTEIPTHTPVPVAVTAMVIKTLEPQFVFHTATPTILPTPFKGKWKPSPTALTSGYYLLAFSKKVSIKETFYIKIQTLPDSLCRIKIYNGKKTLTGTGSGFKEVKPDSLGICEYGYKFTSEQIGLWNLTIEAAGISNPYVITVTK